MTPDRSAFRGARANAASASPDTSASVSDSSRKEHQSSRTHSDRMISSQEGKRAAGLSREEMQTLQRLRERESKVRSHEQAHVAAGGRYVRGGPSYTYRMGPDGRMYAVGGEVSIDSSPVPGDPEATVEKARQIRRAALAPSNPSAQDLRTAAKASRMEAKAKAQLRREEEGAIGAAIRTQAGEQAPEPQSGDNPASTESPGRKGIQGLLHAPLRVAQQAYLHQSRLEDYFAPFVGRRINQIV